MRSFTYEGKNYLPVSISLGLGFLTVTVVWFIYNLFVPVYLQAGNASFDDQNLAGINGFGLSSTITGVIMSLDNVAALLIIPIVGLISDRTVTRFGRRYPYILAGAPIVAVSFVLIPIAGGMIAENLNGSVANNPGAFSLFFAAILVLVISMGVMRGPIVALMPDLIPSRLRSNANGISNFLGGVGTIAAALAIASLFDIHAVLPFLVSVLIMWGIVIWLFLTIKEPRYTAASMHLEEPSGLNIPATLGALPKDLRKSMLFLLLSVFGGWAAFAPIQTFFSSYAVNSLDLTISESARIFAVAIISFIIFAIPAAYIARVIGRRKAIIAGMGLFGVVMLGAWMTLNVTFIIILLALSGIAFALMSTNMLPMVVDVHKDLRLIGTYTGLYYFATQSADVISPVLAGWAIDLSGRNFQAIYLVAALFVGMAFVCMLFVSHGEPQGSEGTMEYQGR